VYVTPPRGWRCKGVTDLKLPKPLFPNRMVVAPLLHRAKNDQSDAVSFEANAATKPLESFLHLLRKTTVLNSHLKFAQMAVVLE
jgi:hypothetical protein